MTQPKNSDSQIQLDSLPSAKIAAVKEQVSTVGHDVQELGRLAREAAREEFALLRERGEQAGLHVRARADEMEDALRDSVRGNPLRSLAYAAGLGIVLGFFLRR